MYRFDRSARGVYLITVTPFTDASALDLASTDRMVDFCLERGVTGLTILGIMGEYIGRIFEEVKNRPLYLIARGKPRDEAAADASASAASSCPRS